MEFVVLSIVLGLTALVIYLTVTLCRKYLSKKALLWGIVVGFGLLVYAVWPTEEEWTAHLQKMEAERVAEQEAEAVERREKEARQAAELKAGLDSDKVPIKAKWKYENKNNSEIYEGTEYSMLEVFRSGKNFSLPAFYFSCDDRVTFGYIPRWEGDIRAFSKSFFPEKLLIRIDDGEVQRFSFWGDWNSGTPTSSDLLIGVRDARRHIVVGFQMPDGTIKYKASFSAKGSTMAMRRFIENCPVAKRLVGSR